MTCVTIKIPVDRCNSFHSLEYTSFWKYLVQILFIKMENVLKEYFFKDFN